MLDPFADALPIPCELSPDDLIGPVCLDLDDDLPPLRLTYAEAMTPAQQAAFDEAWVAHAAIRRGALELGLRLAVSDQGHLWAFWRDGERLLCYIPALRVWSIPSHGAEGCCSVDRLLELAEAARDDLAQQKTPGD